MATVTARKTVVVAAVLPLGELLVEALTGFRTTSQLPLIAFDTRFEVLAGVLLCVCAATLWSVESAASEESERHRNTMGLGAGVLAMAAFLWLVIDGPPLSRWPWQYTIAGSLVLVLVSLLSFERQAGPFSFLKRLIPESREIVWRRSTGVATACGVAIASMGMAANAETRATLVPRGDGILSWYDSQPSVEMPIDVQTQPDTRVVLIKILDYQCPGCRSVERLYEPVLTELSMAFGEAFKVATADFPLSRECNDTPGILDLHPIACEAAVAVRLAGQNGHADTMRSWLFENQFVLSEELISGKVRELVGPSAWERYREVLATVKDEAETVGRLGARATPTYWINGVLVPPVPPDDLRRIVVRELTRNRPPSASR